MEHMCVLGDMNTDFSRIHSRHTQALNSFIDQENMYIALNHSNSNVSYSYSNSYEELRDEMQNSLDDNLRENGDTQSYKLI